MPDVDIAFWNMQRFNGASATDSARIQPMKTWLTNMAPDVFAACEIGSEGVAAIERDCPYTCVGSYDAAVGSGTGKSQLSLAMFKHDTTQVVAGKAVGSGGGTSPRGIMQLQIGDRSGAASLIMVRKRYERTILLPETVMA